MAPRKRASNVAALAGNRRKTSIVSGYATNPVTGENKPIYYRHQSGFGRGPGFHRSNERRGEPERRSNIDDRRTSPLKESYVPLGAIERLVVHDAALKEKLEGTRLLRVLDRLTIGGTIARI